MRAMADFVVVGGIIVLGAGDRGDDPVRQFRDPRRDGRQPAGRSRCCIVGAQDRFIAGQFQRHFLWLGLKGGAIGGGAAILLFALIAPVEAMIRGNAGAEQFAALFGSITMGFYRLLVLAAQIVVIAAVAAEASRRTVNQTIASI